MIGVAYKKVSATLASHPERITLGEQHSRLGGIGKTPSIQIDEFLGTGTIGKLEEYRSRAAARRSGR